MGEMSEMIIDQMIEEAMNGPDMGFSNYHNYDIWFDQNNIGHSITEMTDYYLKNCINMLKKGDSPLKDGYIKSMTKELERRNKKMDKIKGVQLNVVGVTFSNDDGSNRGRIITEIMKDNTTVSLEREPNNQYDRNAIKVVADGCGQIGYIGKDYSAIIAPMMDQGTQFEAIASDFGEFKNRPYCKITINQL